MLAERWQAGAVESDSEDDGAGCRGPFSRPARRHQTVQRTGRGSINEK